MQKRTERAILNLSTNNLKKKSKTSKKKKNDFHLIHRPFNNNVDSLEFIFDFYSVDAFINHTLIIYRKSLSQNHGTHRQSSIYQI